MFIIFNSPYLAEYFTGICISSKNNKTCLLNMTYWLIESEMNQNQVLKTVNRIMKEKGVTQLQLSSGLNCSQTAVSQLLNGKTRLTFDDLARVAGVFKISVAEIIHESEKDSPTMVTLPADLSKVACKDRLTFRVFNLLKKQCTLVELLNMFDESEWTQIRRIVANLRGENLLAEDMDGNLSVNVPEASSIHFNVTENYNNRIVELYEELRPVVAEALSDPEKLAEWRKRNVDAFYIEYFSQSQIEDQNKFLREFLDFMKKQLRINSLERNRKLKRYEDESELRMLYIVSAPCPTGVK